MAKEQEPKREVGRFKKHLLKGAAAALLVPAAVVAARGEESSLLGIDRHDFTSEEKTAVTFLISTEVLAVSLFGYRMSDGAKIPWEEYGWKYGLPSSNFVGASMLLAEMWR